MAYRYAVACEALDGCCYGYGGIVTAHVRCRYHLTPARNICAAGRYEAHGTEKAGSGIPSAAVGAVLQAHSYGVCAAVLRQIRSYFDSPRAVAVGIERRLLAVDEYRRLVHRTLEYEPCALARSHAECVPVPAYAHIRQSAGASGLQRCLLFHVLHYLHHLQIVVSVERTEYRPVVGDAHLLPFTVVELCRLRPLSVATVELPAVGECRLGTLRCRRRAYGERQQ